MKFWIQRIVRYDASDPQKISVVKYYVFQEGHVWPENDEPRPIASAEYWPPRTFGNQQPEVTFPSLGDKRPEVALALADALKLAAVEAMGQCLEPLKPGDRWEVEL